MITQPVPRPPQFTSSESSLASSPSSSSASSLPTTGAGRAWLSMVVLRAILDGLWHLQVRCQLLKLCRLLLREGELLVPSLLSPVLLLAAVMACSMTGEQPTLSSIMSFANSLHRSHVTGASSTGGTSSSGCAAGAQAPPGSPATSIGTKLSRLGPSSHRSKSLARNGNKPSSFVAGLPTGYRFYTQSRAAAPPCTPCSTDVAEESDYCAGPLYNGGRFVNVN